MPLRINSTNGSVTLTPEDGVGNVDITVPRSPIVGQDHAGEFIADSYNERYEAVTSTSNATTVNCENANSFSHTLTENTTFTFSNPPASGVSYTFSIEIIQDASASGFTVTWPASVDWPSATAPTLTATASAKDVFVFMTRDGGTTWYGFTAGQALGQVMATKKKLLQVSGGVDGWDISNLTFEGAQRIGIKKITEDSIPRDSFLKPDGTKLYVLGDTSDLILEYNLSTAWEISTASYYQQKDISSFAFGSKWSIYFSSDGTSMYIQGSQDYIYQFALSTAWDISTATAVASLDISSRDLSSSGIAFNSSGTRLYFVGGQFDRAYQYNLSIAWDISTASFWTSADISAEEPNPYDLFIGDSGTKMYVVGVSGYVYQYTLNTADLVSSKFYVQSLQVNTPAGSPYGIFFKPDGTEMYITGASDYIVKYNLSTAWDISTASLQLPTQFSVASQTTLPYGIHFKTNGTKMYIVGSSTVYAYNLSTSWDVSTASYANEQISVASSETSPTDVFFKPDGTKMYVVGWGSDVVLEYDLSTPWQVNSATLLQTLSISAQSSYSSGLFFKPDGTKMYVSDYFLDDIFSYNLSTAWDISTASFDYQLDISAQTPNAMELFFKPDGLIMFLVDQTNLNIVEYILNTAWDISTASYSQSVSISQATVSPYGLHFKDDGTKAYVVDPTTDGVITFDL